MLTLHTSAKIVVVSVAVVGLMAATIAGAIWVTHTQSAKLANGQRVCDVASYDSYTVTIKDNRARPAHTSAKLCDHLTITNLDYIEREVAFGPHENHVAYDGVTERLLDRGQSLSVTLVQAGNFRFHDHFQDEVQGTFSVSPTRK
ncbi:MAG: hypothetical protein WA843_03090 [Candidatus Saccharimonadales bacterium]